MATVHTLLAHQEWAALIGGVVDFEDIPPQLIGTFLPNPQITISEFVRFNLLPLPLRKSAVTIQLSEKPYDIDVTRLSDDLLRRMDYPSDTVFQRFLKQSQSALSTSQSVEVGLLRLPIVVLRVWSLWLRVTLIWDAFIETYHWLESSAKKYPTLVEDIRTSISVLEWSAPLKGFGIQCGAGLLSRFLSSNWLAGDDIDIIIEFLAKEFALSGVSMCFLH